MLRGANTQKKLLYISDWATDDVYVYTYPNFVLQGQLTGFSKPYGQCVDADGNVWIANYGGSTIVEYAHGVSTPTATLTTDGSPIGCAVSKTGNLAVADFSTPSGPGNIEVFTNETGTPAEYSNASCDNLWPPGYDNKGNLWVFGTGSSTNLCELPNQGTALAPVAFAQKINAPGSIMWDGKYMAITDRAYKETQSTGIYQAQVSTAGLTVVSSTPLRDTCLGRFDLTPQPFVVGSQDTPLTKKEGTVVVGGNWLCANRFALWAYPWPGGAPILLLSNAPAEPYGESLSKVDK